MKYESGGGGGGGIGGMIMTGIGRTAGTKTNPIAFVHQEFHNVRDDSLLFLRHEDTTAVLIKISLLL